MSNENVELGKVQGAQSSQVVHFGKIEIPNLLSKIPGLRLIDATSLRMSSFGLRLLR